MQLVGDLVVCWNELDVGGQTGQGEAWRNETRRCVTNFNCKSTWSCDLLRVGSNNLEILFSKSHTTGTSSTTTTTTTTTGGAEVRDVASRARYVFFLILNNFTYKKTILKVFFFGFHSTYIQLLLLLIHIPFYTDTALHITPQPLFSSLGFITHLLTRSYTAASRLWSYADIGSTFPWKWRYQQWLARCIRFPTSFGVLWVFFLVICCICSWIDISGCSLLLTQVQPKRIPFDQTRPPPHDDDERPPPQSFNIIHIHPSL